MKLSLRKIKGFGKRKWQDEKKKAAVFSKMFMDNPIGRQVVHQNMKLSWYNHIDKALEGKLEQSDAKHWKRMVKQFRKEIVGIPSGETLQLLEWLEGFAERIKRQKSEKNDFKVMLPLFRSYMEDCEANASDNYILKNKLWE